MQITMQLTMLNGAPNRRGKPLLKRRSAGDVRVHRPQQLTKCISLATCLIITRRVRPPNGGRNEANSWETGSEYSSGETYTAAATPARAAVASVYC